MSSLSLVSGTHEGSIVCVEKAGVSHSTVLNISYGFIELLWYTLPGLDSNYRFR